MVKRFMDGGAIPNAYPFVSQNAPIPEPEDSVQVGAKPEPLDNVMPAMGPAPTFKKGGKVKSSASKRADGCAQRGKTRA